MTLIESFPLNSAEDLEKLLDVYIDVKTEDRYQCDSVDERADPRKLLKGFSYSTCEVDGVVTSDTGKQNQLIEIAHKLKDIAENFHLERKSTDPDLDGLNPDEIIVVKEIFSLYQPSVTDIADAVLKNLTPKTLGYSLDLLIKSTDDRVSQIGLPFDLIGAMYALKGAVNIPSWVKKCCVQHITKNNAAQK